MSATILTIDRAVIEAGRDWRALRSRAFDPCDPHAWEWRPAEAAARAVLVRLARRDPETAWRFRQ